jgi:hypothetical protein
MPHTPWQRGFFNGQNVQPTQDLSGEQLAKTCAKPGDKKELNPGLFFPRLSNQWKSSFLSPYPQKTPQAQA